MANNKFSFDIFTNTSEELSELGESDSIDKKSDATSQPSVKREFRPKTPSSIKIAKGERGKVIEKLKNELKRQIVEQNPSFSETNTTVPSPSSTDLNGIDPEIRAILNSMNIFFFKDIPQNIIIVYGSLLSSQGNSETYQGLEESRILDFDKLIQSPIKSQKILIK
jgi:hypothetical protein